MMLLANSRLSYSELAEKLNLSVNAIHKRIQQLMEANVIVNFTAKPSALVAGATTVFFSGTSRLASLQELPDKMKAQGSVYWLALGGGKYLHIGAHLRNLNEIAPLVNYIKQEAGLLEPTIGIIAAPVPTTDFKQSDLELCELDYRIIRSLKDNSRKPIADIADELAISAKTVHRRLNRMIENGLIELSMDWYPDKSNDIITLMDVRLVPQADASRAWAIMRKYAPNTLFYWSFVNLPNTLTYVLWTNTMNEFQTLRQEIEQEEGVQSVVPNILYTGYIFKTWRDQF